MASSRMNPLSGPIIESHHAAQTLFEKIWESHVVRAEPEGPPCSISIVSCPRSDIDAGVEGLKLSGRRLDVRCHVGGAGSHARPPTDHGIADPLSANRSDVEENCRDSASHSSLERIRQGVVHVIGPERASPCGDDHRVRRFATSTHGAFGALAFGIGTSEVEHVLATQCLVQKRPRTWRFARRSAVDSLFSEGRHSGIIGKIEQRRYRLVIEYTARRSAPS